MHNGDKASEYMTVSRRPWNPNGEGGVPVSTTIQVQPLVAEEPMMQMIINTSINTNKSQLSHIEVDESKLYHFALSLDADIPATNYIVTVII